MASSSRRSSYLTERKDIGDPYQIYTEIVNAGKHLEGECLLRNKTYPTSNCNI